jgi:hypothetical protein
MRMRPVLVDEGRASKLTNTKALEQRISYREAKVLRVDGEQDRNSGRRGPARNRETKNKRLVYNQNEIEGSVPKVNVWYPDQERLLKIF